MTLDEDEYRPDDSEGDAIEEDVLVEGSVEASSSTAAVAEKSTALLSLTIQYSGISFHLLHAIIVYITNMSP